MRRDMRTGYLLSLLAALAWAATSPGIKYLLDVQHIPALAIAFWRDAIIAVACIGTLLIVRRDLLRVRWRELRSLALIGTISIGIYHALWVFSIMLNGAAVATVLIYTFPTFVTLGAWLLFHERMHWQQLAALALSLLGCVLLVRAYDPAVLRVSGLGILVGLGTGLTHAGYVLFSQRAVETKSPWTSLSYTMLFGAIALLIFWLISGLVGLTPPAESANIVRAVGASATPWLGLLVIALGPTLGGYALFTIALRYLPGRLASLVSVVEAPLSALIAVTLLGERLEWPQTIGMLLILAGASLPPLLMGLQRQADHGHAPVLVNEPTVDVSKAV